MIKINKQILMPLMFIFIIIITIQITKAEVAQIANIPDVCLPYNYEYYDIWAEDYFSYEYWDTARVRFRDPVNNQTLLMNTGYGTLNLYCYELSLTQQDRGGPYTTERLRIESLTDSCSVPIRLSIHDADSDSYVASEFTLTVSEECQGIPDETPPYVDAPENLTDYIGSHYSFENNLYDLTGGFNAKAIQGPTYSGDSLYGQALELNATSHVSVNESVAYERWLDGNYSLSYWVKNNTYLSSEYLIINVPGDYLVTLGYSTPDGWRIQTGATTASGTGLDGDYHLIVTTMENGQTKKYFDANLEQTVAQASGVRNFNLGGESGDTALLDEFTVWTKALTQDQITQLYNGGTGIQFQEGSSPYAPTITQINDTYMNASQNITIDLDDYITNWEDVFVSADSPTGSARVRITTGYQSINADYFDFTVYPNGTLQIQSYERTHQVEVEYGGCNYNPTEYCANESFTLYIDADLANVTSLNTMEAYHDLGFFGYRTFSMNYYFINHNRTMLSFPESNWTGVLNASFPYNYSIIEEPVRNASFMVYIPCTITDDYYEYNYLGDLNVTLQCGNREAYYILTAYNNYNQKVYFTGLNRNSSLTKSTTILSGNPNYLSGQLPTDYLSVDNNLTSNTTQYDTHVRPFLNILDQNMSESGQKRLVFMITIILMIVTFIPMAKYAGTNFAITSSIIIAIVSLIFFASAGFITYTYPIMLSVLMLVYISIKFIKGGL